MNKTKKRAAKRAAQATTVKAPVKPRRRTKWQWPHSLIPFYKIDNVKAYREYYGCTLREAKDAVEAAMPSTDDMPF
jgi:ribosomal protein L7/L12